MKIELAENYGFCFGVKRKEKVSFASKKQTSAHLDIFIYAIW